MKKQLVLALIVSIFASEIKASEAQNPAAAVSFFSGFANKLTSIGATVANTAKQLNNDLISPNITALKNIKLDDCKQFITDNQASIQKAAIVVASVAVFYTVYKINQKNKAKRINAECAAGYSLE